MFKYCMKCSSILEKDKLIGFNGNTGEADYTYVCSKNACHGGHFFGESVVEGWFWSRKYKRVCERCGYECYSTERYPGLD